MIILLYRSFLEGDFKPEISKHGSPKRTTVLVLAETSLYMFKFGLGKLGTEAVRLALECEKAADDKSKARGKPTLTAPYIRQMLFRADSMQILYSSDRSNVSTKKTFIEKAQDALFAAVDTQDKVRCYLQLAQSQIACGFAVNEIADCFLNAMQLTSDMPLDILKTSCLVPLDAMVQVAKLLLSAAKFEDALNVLLFSCSVYNSATLFLLLGICCYRLDRLEDAEDALLEANLEDNRNPEIWGYLCLLALAHGPHRLEEADAALVQCLRLGLSNTSLLRELATCYMAVDKLQTAEDLIRRAMSKENVDDFLFIGGSKQNAYTRKLLADVMAGQSQAAQAVEEYQKVLADSELDPQTRLDAAERCARLLGTLGRSEELKALTQIINSLSASE